MVSGEASLGSRLYEAGEVGNVVVDELFKLSSWVVDRQDVPICANKLAAPMVHLLLCYRILMEKSFLLFVCRRDAVDLGNYLLLSFIHDEAMPDVLLLP